MSKQKLRHNYKNISNKNNRKKAKRSWRRAAKVLLKQMKFTIYIQTQEVKHGRINTR